jgi:hypothetical protein
VNMAGIGASPNPDADRPRPTFGWVDLPAEGRSGPAPDLPTPPVWLNEFGGWPVATRAAWKRLWETPQATQWDQSGKTLHGWAQLHAHCELSGPQPSRVAEMRQHEDRHGLNPRALMQLRWRVVSSEPDVVPVVSAKVKRSGMDRKSRMLKVVQDGEKEGT